MATASAPVRTSNDRAETEGSEGVGTAIASRLATSRSRVRGRSPLAIPSGTPPIATVNPASPSRRTVPPLGIRRAA